MSLSAIISKVNRLKAIKAAQTISTPTDKPPAKILDLVPWLNPLRTPERPTWLAPYVKTLECALGGELRIALSCPPQHGKTETTLGAFVAWALVAPEKSYAYLTFSVHKAREVSKLLQMRLRRAGVEFTGTLESIQLKGGGQIIISSLAAGIIGHPINGVCVIDDPYGGQADANSDTYRKDLVNSLRGNVMTRMHPGASIVIMHTRWHPQDLIATVTDDKLEDKDRFDYINIQAIAEADDILGREVGEPLAPSFRPLTWLERQRGPGGVGEFVFVQQYQGKPRLRGAGLFQEPSFYSVLPTAGYRGGYGIDLAYTVTTRSDYSVLVKALCVPGEYAHLDRYYVTDVLRVRASLEQFGVKVAQEIATQPSWAVAFRGSTIERYGAVQLLKRPPFNIPIRVMKSRGDKRTNAEALAMAWNTGRWLLPDPATFPDATWVPDYVTEHQEFVGEGKEHDDTIDASANCHDMLASARTLIPTDGGRAAQSRVW